MLHVVILAGGGGTRLWPLSRPDTPKQFLSLIGDHSLLQQTLLRVIGLVPSERLWIVTGAEQQALVQSHVTRLSVFPSDRVHILTEPVGRNTAAAIGLAAVHLQQADPEATMLVLPADHWIERERDFTTLVEASLCWAHQGSLVTFGVVPSYPATGYGYIQRGELCRPTQDLSPAYSVARFVEKPPVAVATDYLNRGDYYWNAGIFLWQATTILAEIAVHLPTLASTLQELTQSFHTENFSTALGTLYPHLPSVSIDTGVLEKSSQIVVVPADIGWSDIGEWTALHKLSSQDEQGNAVRGQGIVEDSRNTFIYSSHRPVAAIGVSNLVVVEAEDAVLVCAQDHIQAVKTVGQQLSPPKDTSLCAGALGTTEQRQWGTFTILEETPYYKVKRLVVQPSRALSLQQHTHRNEHWVVVQGTAQVINGDREFSLVANQSTYIPKGTIHRLTNPGPELLEVIEVQTGSYFGEDDIVRYS